MHYKITLPENIAHLLEEMDCLGFASATKAAGNLLLHEDFRHRWELAAKFSGELLEPTEYYDLIFWVLVQQGKCPSVSSVYVSREKYKTC